MTPEDEEAFASMYLRWLQRGAFNHPIEEDWERELRQKNEKPAERCRHGQSPLQCAQCYFNGPDTP